MANEQTSFRHKVLSSLAWQGSAQLLGQLLSWGSTIFVIRLLDPGDYGIMAMATLFVSFLLMLSDLGIGAAIVQAEEIDEDDFRTIQGLIWVFNGLGFALTFAASIPIAMFFGEERLVPILNTLSACFLLMGLYVLPQSRLMRDLEFDKKAKVDFATLACSAVAALSCALLGFGVWSLVAGTLATHLSRAIGFHFMGPGFVMPELSMERGRRFLRFGTVVVVSRILWFLYSGLDVALAGKLLGKELLGVYSVALTLAAIPLDKVMPVLTQVAFPAVARIQHEKERVRENMLTALRFGNTLFLPVFWGMAWVAADGLPILLGEKWSGAVIPFRLICIILPLKALAALLPPALSGLGRPMVNVVNMAISLGLLSVGLFIGAQYGLFGLAMAWVVVYPLVFAIITTRALPVIGARWSELIAVLSPSVFGGIAMSTVIYGIQALTSAWIPELRLLASVASGGAVYLGTIAVLDRSSIREVRGFLAR